MCKLIRHKNIMPGWGCCECSTYNGEQRDNCKICKHERCGEAIHTKDLCSSCFIRESTGILFKLCDECMEELENKINENTKNKSKN